MTRLSQSNSVLSSEFSKMLKYFHKRKQEYHGVGICDDCGQRIMFKGNFPTFKTRYLEIMKKELDEMKLIGYNKDAINEISRRINQKLTDESLIDTYSIHFKRELEKSLM